jgi:hypothetical protein
MFIQALVMTALIVQTLCIGQSVVADTPPLNGYYHMMIPNNDNQYVFNVDWSHNLQRYVVTVTGQSLAWATARLDIVNETSVSLLADNGFSLPGTIEYQADQPSICWPTTKDFTCWNRLLSNITRIHVINMYGRCLSSDIAHFAFVSLGII